MEKVHKNDKHLTGSVWVITLDSKKVLLILHRKFNKWMQPGGHVERNENPVEAAVRETREETGIDVSILLTKIEKAGSDAYLLPPADFLFEEFIPKSSLQPQHYHLDMMYVVKVKEQEVLHNNRESEDIGWFSKKEALSLNIHDDSRIILGKILK